MIDNSTLMFIPAIIVVGVVLFAVVSQIQKSRNKIDKQYFISHWNSIQKKFQNTPDRWMEVIIEADKLVDEALKQRKYKGKTMGERMVSANRTFKDPDMVWKAHKLRNKVVHEPGVQVKKQHVGFALRGYRKALKDLEVI